MSYFFFTFEKNVAFLNPFGFISLKRETYLDEPNKRQKDFADILELISGLVEKGTHFKIANLWSRVLGCAESVQIEKMLADIINETNTAWDIEDVRADLIKRNFSSSFIDENDKEYDFGNPSNEQYVFNSSMNEDSQNPSKYDSYTGKLFEIKYKSPIVLTSHNA